MASRSPLTLLVGLCFAQPATGQEPYVAPNAPQDRVAIFSKDASTRLDSILQPLVREARASYPGARGRYLAGLPARHGFFVVTMLVDSLDNREVVFLGVDSLARDSVFGRVWNQIQRVRGYRLYQPHAIRESELLDWLITGPDGTEEGNLIGKFMDNYRE